MESLKRSALKTLISMLKEKSETLIDYAVAEQERWEQLPDSVKGDDQEPETATHLSSASSLLTLAIDELEACLKAAEAGGG